ncbi:MAG: hypothetical protein WDW36_006322 [Sanguina aurantia]
MQTSLLDKIEVKSVDGFQGREKRVVVMSAVRSNTSGGIGFMTDVRRLNVAITRARFGLVIIGDADTLSRNSPVWKAYIEWLLSHSCFMSEQQLTTALWGSAQPRQQRLLQQERHLALVKQQEKEDERRRAQKDLGEEKRRLALEKVQAQQQQQQQQQQRSQQSASAGRGGQITLGRPQNQGRGMGRDQSVVSGGSGLGSTSAGRVGAGSQPASAYSEARGGWYVQRVRAKRLGGDDGSQRLSSILPAPEPAVGTAGVSLDGSATAGVARGGQAQHARQSARLHKQPPDSPKQQAKQQLDSLLSREGDVPQRAIVGAFFPMSGDAETSIDSQPSSSSSGSSNSSSSSSQKVREAVRDDVHTGRSQSSSTLAAKLQRIGRGAAPESGQEEASAMRCPALTRSDVTTNTWRQLSIEMTCNSELSGGPATKFNNVGTNMPELV